MDERALYDALRESVGRQVLVPDPTAGVERYAFRHALLQEAVYDDLLPGERTRLHSAFARTLEAAATPGRSHAAELAYHWYAAHDLPAALEAAVQAGVAAEAGYAFPEAVASTSEPSTCGTRSPMPRPAPAVTGSTCLRPSPASPGSTNRAAPSPTSGQRSAWSNQAGDRSGADFSMSGSGDTRGSPARARPPRRPIGRRWN